jgi:hypothetical protein
MTGHCAHFALVKCERWKNQCYQCPLTREYPKSWLIDRSKQNYILKKELFTSIENLTIIPTSKWVEGIVSQSYLSSLPRKTITNGIDTQIFHPTKDVIGIKHKYNINGDFIILGVATEWNAKKRII